MKKVLFLLISIVSLQGLNLKAEGINGVMKKIYVLGEEIQGELEKNLTQEFKKISDEIFGNMKETDISSVEKRFQANTKVDLMKVLDAAMDKGIFDKIEQFLKRFNGEEKKLFQDRALWAHYQDMHNKYHRNWPHHPNLRIVMAIGAFQFNPKPLMLDRMTCGFCGVEAFGLNEGTLPEYWHRYNCSVRNIMASLKINAETDARLSVSQRIRFAYANSVADTKTLSEREKYIVESYRIDVTNGEIVPKISEALSASISMTGISIIIEYLNYIKLKNFLEFYEKFGKIRGFILFEQYVADPYNRASVKPGWL